MGQISSLCILTTFSLLSWLASLKSGQLAKNNLNKLVYVVFGLGASSDDCLWVIINAVNCRAGKNFDETSP